MLQTTQGGGVGGSSGSVRAKKVSPATRLIRGPRIEVLIKRASGVPYPEALRIAEEGKRVLASNKRLSMALLETGEWKWKRMMGAFGCWSGTMAAYIEPGEKLGKYVMYTDPRGGQRYIFPVPEQYQGEKDTILLSEHPNFELFPFGRDLIVKASEVSAIGRFPKSDDWYICEKEFGIPIGATVSPSDKKAAYLWRTGRRVGPVARYDIGFDGGCRNCVYLSVPSGPLGVVVEAPGRAPRTLKETPEPKAILEIAGKTPGEVRALIDSLSHELGRLGEGAKGGLLSSARELVALLTNARTRE